MTDPFAILVASRSEIREQRERLHLWPFILLALVLLGAAVIFFPSHMPPPVIAQTESPTPGPNEPRVYVVQYRYGVFSPTNLRIHVGYTVRWHNGGSTDIRIVGDPVGGSKNASFDSVGPVLPDGYFSYTFSIPAVYGYTNEKNTDQSGVIIVRE
jgi:plastocyanin